MNFFPVFPDDYYLYPDYEDTITGQDLLEVLHEFDKENGIHETVLDYFGEYVSDPALRPGPFGDGKVQILIFNIHDNISLVLNP